MIQTNIKKLFEEAGLESIRPTDQALIEMGLSRRRFSFLLENVHKTAITVQEVNAIQSWLEGIKAINADQVVGNHLDTAEIAESLGLSK